MDDTGVHPHAEGLAAAIESMGLAGLLTARAEAANLVAVLVEVDVEPLPTGG